ncbi:hypothetical protein RFI36_17360 [Acinetobacter gerneri]|uniref:DUF4175 domain-containing protein n=2 Tax=Acinetobacter gerneri TaxID=202952 RepID=N8ZJE2_9GAMM|nr:hypothetical protein [Acinetobacter gerneri]ENV31863.1 hypothetical protein F960_04232 [Acinetobacter gerneri DSM 14967 = CIP 107464 = MTCC 9824]EPR82573.1 hypothetical protein L289_2971 [Acinetobacter gerneri DSM 14967 = CIP 107464 = MTCC 9824]MCH4243611.1 hypothetical protein [Acinetobacter gerneri]MDQ9011453.1 hypothetical protein [Acinetobacter gerneri]MDQ9015606.1 hypothetical protein [Acinetobacter gerneri]
MNAPRQGLFASLLTISFALHTILLVIATTHQLNENRANQGQLMTSQLVTDSIAELDPANTVSLALLANRYATNPSVASIRILDANKQVLATGGMSKTREGDVFSREAVQNEKKVGSVEITLIKPSIGEILRNQWLAIFVSLIIHVLLWLAYRAIARPSRSEYLARINKEARLKHEIQALTKALEDEKHATAIAMAPKPQAPKEKVFPKIPTELLKDEETLALSIQFYDPKQLLNTVNQSVSAPYFNLCQIFLNKSIELCAAHFNLQSKDINVSQNFEYQGAVIQIASRLPQATECILMVGTVFQLLSEVLYKRYREDKRFVLQTRCAVSTAVEAMQLNSVQAAERLAQHLIAKEMALHLDNEHLKQISENFQLVAMPNPTNVLTRHAFMINGMDNDSAETAQNIRTEILKGKKAQVENPSASERAS